MAVAVVGRRPGLEGNFNSHLAVRAMVLLACLWLAGCATVAPYERERLAKPDMADGPSAEARAGQDHATAYREGSTGAVGGAGAGCGCN